MKYLFALLFLFSISFAENCSLENPDLCTDRNSCLLNSGFWCTNTCSPNECCVSSCNENCIDKEIKETLCFAGSCIETGNKKSVECCLDSDCKNGKCINNSCFSIEEEIIVKAKSFFEKIIQLIVSLFHQA